MKRISNRGFTLIELLVVIAIIGILASIVLVSLNSARNKGKDTRILSDVNQIRNQIESEQTAGGTYVGAASGKCLTNAATAGFSGNCTTLQTDVANNTGSAGVKTNPAGGATSYTAYAVYAQLNSGQYYCVDSTGNNSTTGAAPTTYTCP